MLVISEIKTRSPFGFVSARSWDELFDLAVRQPGWLSVHTDPRWGGSLDLVRKARHRAPDKPIVAKGIHPTADDVRAALDAGANLVLVVGWPHPCSDIGALLVEPRSLEELVQLREDAPDARAVWNQRDLATGARRADDFSAARAAWPGWLCQASFVRSVEDVHALADAVLVGEHLAGFWAFFRGR